MCTKPHDVVSALVYLLILNSIFSIYIFIIEQCLNRAIKATAYSHLLCKLVYLFHTIISFFLNLYAKYFFNENFAKDQNTLIEQSFTQIIRKYFYMKSFVSELW